MPRKRKHKSIPIVNLDDVQVPDLQKKHYEKLGYKPYLSDSGKIKWQSSDQHAYERMRYDIGKRWLRFSPKLSQKRKQLIRFVKRISRVLLRNWLIFLSVFITIILLIYADSILMYFSK